MGAVCSELQTLEISGSLEVTYYGILSVLSGGVQSSLLSADLIGTGSNRAALGCILNRAKRLRCLRADQNIWEELLNCCNSRYVHLCKSTLNDVMQCMHIILIFPPAIQIF